MASFFECCKEQLVDIDKEISKIEKSLAELEKKKVQLEERRNLLLDHLSEYLLMRGQIELRRLLLTRRKRT